MPKNKTKPLASLVGLMMLHLVMLEAVLITLAALLPDEGVDHVQAALDTAAEHPGFRRGDRETLSAIGDGLMTQILERSEEIADV